MEVQRLLILPENILAKKIEEDGAISYDSLLVAIKSADSVETKVTGLVSGVCQTKGCWMDIVSDKDSTAESMFVEFKDYAFLCQKILPAKSGYLRKRYRDVTSVEDLKHYAEDEGQSPEEIAKITEAKEELKFMASGVKFWTEIQNQTINNLLRLHSLISKNIYDRYTPQPIND
ncbi:MAG: DUF4920 domain-containing protein [Saprospiraceae bacterium]|nr:DUF4920 domain-containing protein [Saprospiraceae bacterium]